MKKFVTLFLFLCLISNLHANDPERVNYLAGKVSFKDDQAFFILHDGSCWKVFPFVERWRTLSEWWNDEKIVPDSYKGLPKDWALRSQIEVYQKNGSLCLSLENASNQQELVQCTHILVNSHSEQILFAVSSSPQDCIMDTYQKAKKEGYDRGYDDGYKNGYRRGQDNPQFMNEE